LIGILHIVRFFEKFGGRASPPFHFIKGTYMSSLLHAVYGILARGGEENSKGQTWATYSKIEQDHIYTNNIYAAG
jgi:hypothetical protein